MPLKAAGIYRHLRRSSSYSWVEIFFGGKGSVPETHPLPRCDGGGAVVAGCLDLGRRGRGVRVGLACQALS